MNTNTAAGTMNGRGETMSRFKCYGVSRGRGVGIFGTWKECREMVKDFPGARFRGFYSRADAESWLTYEGEREKAGYCQHSDGYAGPSRK